LATLGLMRMLDGVLQRTSFPPCLIEKRHFIVQRALAHEATELLELIEPAPGRLRDDAPRLRYLLLDEGTIDESAPWALRCYPKAIV